MSGVIRAPKSLPVVRFVPALAACGVLLLAGCGTATGQQGQQGRESAAPSGECSYTAEGDPAKPVDPPSTNGIKRSGQVTWTLTTSQGDLTLTGDAEHAPCTVHSFDSLVKQQYFDDTRCHRLVDSGIFVLQCGDPSATGRGGPGYSFPDEKSALNSYKQGAVAMANSGPDTNGSQFFLVYQDSELPPNYTVFATMDQASIDVVGRIAAEGQDGSNQDGSGVPNNEAKIIKAAPKA